MVADEGEAPFGVQVVELLTAGRYLILFGADAADVPDADELGDLRYQARKEARAPVLDFGLDETYAVQTVIAAIVSGVVTPAVWSPAPAAKRWIERTIRKRRERAAAVGGTSAGPTAGQATVQDGRAPSIAAASDPVAQADALLRDVLRSRGEVKDTQLLGVRGDGEMWTVEMSADDSWMAVVRIAKDGSLADVAIEPVRRR